MQPISAFVGHSFADEDRDVVARILGVLDSIRSVMPTFSWDHAEKAEPREITEKILEKVQGKNLFIAICTGQEEVFAPESSGSHWFLPKWKILLDRNSIQKKPSDWVIQEIGLAVGRGLNIIILLEKNVRKPGSLQGTLEHITFERTAPELCLEKLTSMLSALAGSSALPSTPPASEQVATAQAPQQKELGVDDLLSPDPNWTLSQFAIYHGLAIEWREEKSEKAILDAFNKSAYAASNQGRSVFEARAIVSTARTDQVPWKKPLEDLLVKYPGSYAPHEAMGDQYSSMEEYDLAADQYERAVGLADGVQVKIRLVADAALARAKATNANAAEALIRDWAVLVSGAPQNEAFGLQQIAPVWRALNNDSMFLACLERLLEISPDDDADRFALAYRYSEMDRKADAFYHYQQHLKVNRSELALNNFGVSAAALKLPVTAVNAYKDAETAGNTLASSNLAYLLLEAGFVTEAKQKCEIGLAKENPDTRLHDAFAAVERAQDSENDRARQLVEGSSARRLLLRRMGVAGLAPVPTQLAKRWRDANCELTAELSGSALVLKGSYERQSFGNLLISEAGRTVPTDVEYRGKLYGCAFLGVCRSRESGKGYSTLLGSGEEDCIGLIDVERGAITLMKGAEQVVITVSSAAT